MLGHQVTYSFKALFGKSIVKLLIGNTESRLLLNWLASLIKSLEEHLIICVFVAHLSLHGNCTISIMCLAWRIISNVFIVLRLDAMSHPAIVCLV